MLINPLDIIPEGTVKEHGHGNVYCSCGTILSRCKCHPYTSGMKIKVCKKCTSPKKEIAKQSAKAKATKPKKAKYVPSMPRVDIMPEAELRRILKALQTKNKQRGDE